MSRADYVIGLIIGSMIICLTVVVQPYAWLGDLFVRLFGALLVFFLGCDYGFNKGKDGADNE